MKKRTFQNVIGGRGVIGEVLVDGFGVVFRQGDGRALEQLSYQNVYG